jgi:hypothetical protein
VGVLQRIQHDGTFGFAVADGSTGGVTGRGTAFGRIIKRVVNLPALVRPKPKSRRDASFNHVTRNTAGKIVAPLAAVVGRSLHAIFDVGGFDLRSDLRAVMENYSLRVNDQDTVIVLAEIIAPRVVSQARSRA